jgi:osmotically-inducible protein OsmY
MCAAPHFNGANNISPGDITIAEQLEEKNMYRDDAEYRRWHEYGRDRGWFDRASDEVRSWLGDDDAEMRRDMDRMQNRGSMYRHERDENRPYGYMYGSQTFDREGPIDRWTLGGTEFGEYGTRPVEQLRRGNHYGRGPANYKRNDERIKEDVIERLVRNHEIDGSDIEVEVNNGEVTLKGIVESRYERRFAEDITEDVFGVKNVLNLLRVRESMGINNPNPSPGEEVQPRTKGGVMGVTPGGNNK